MAAMTILTTLAMSAYSIAVAPEVSVNRSFCVLPVIAASSVRLSTLSYSTIHPATATIAANGLMLLSGRGTALTYKMETR